MNPIDSPNATERDGVADRGGIEATAPRQPPRLPLRAWLALGLMLVIVAGAGYLLYQRLFPTTHDAGELLEIVPGRIRFGGPGGGVEPDSVRRISANNYQVRAGDARVTARRSDGDAEWTFTFGYFNPNLLTPEQTAALNARFRLPRDARFAQSLNVTAEQIKRLEQIPGREGMVVSDADRAQVKTLFEAYVNAPPPRSEQTAALLEAVRRLGQQNLEPTRAALAQRAEQVRQILTPEQIAPFAPRTN